MQKILTAILVLLLFVTAGHSQTLDASPSETQTLTLSQARSLALEHNRKAADAALTLQIAQQAVRQYRANYFPDISLNAAAVYGTSQKTLFEAPLSQYSALLSQVTGMPMQLPDIKLDWEFGWLWNAGVMLKQPIYMGGRIVAANNIARRSVAMARHNQRLTDIEIIEQTDEAFVNVVRAQELEVVARKYLDLLTELERNVQSAVDLGMKMPADLLRVQVKKNEVELQLRKAENGLRLAKMNLRYVTGGTRAGLEDVTCVLDDLDLNDECKIISPSPCGEGWGGVIRPETLILQERLAIAHQQVRLARAEALPSVALLATYGYTNGLKVGNKRLFDGADFMGGVTVSVPLFHFGERAAKIRQAKLREQQARLACDDVDEQLQLALEKAQNEADEALLEQQLCARSLEQAALSMQTTQRQYDAGMATLGDLLDVQALWQQAYERQIEARCNLHTTRTALQKALGTLR